jgi:DNA-binding response OmpR family regulator
MYLLLVEDDPNLGRALEKLLKPLYQVEWLRTLSEASSHVAVADYDVVLLDLGLPDGDGVDWLRSMRRKNWMTPVLVLSARDALDDRVRGLDTGADDYLVKPFEADELLARIRVLLRRQSGAANPCLTFGELSFVAELQQFYLRGEEIALPPKEYQILAVLMQAATKPVSRERLLQQLYGLGDGVDSNALDVHIHSLRKLVGKDRIETRRGFGYRLIEI